MASGRGENSKYCVHCDKTGIIMEPHFEHLDTDPLLPCPKCVLPGCKCSGKEPYYYHGGGDIHLCPCRDIRLKIDKITKIYANSGIDRKYRWKRIQDFKPKNDLLNKAKTAVYSITNDFYNTEKGLFLWGNPGTGKTLLASILMTELIIRYALEGRFISISRLFNQIRQTFVEGSPTYGKSGEIERRLVEVDILVIDDFGVQKDSPWTHETLYNLVDARYEAERFTVFTSNKNPASFSELSDGRILSRIKEMCRIMEMSGEDFRESL